MKMVLNEFYAIKIKDGGFINLLHNEKIAVEGELQNATFFKAQEDVKKVFEDMNRNYFRFTNMEFDVISVSIGVTGYMRRANVETLKGK